MLGQVAKLNQEPSGSRQRRAEGPEDLTEDGQDAHQQEAGDQQGDNDDENGVNDGRFDFPPQAHRALEHPRQPVQDFGQQSCAFAAGDHGNVEPAEDFGAGGDGGGKAGSRFDSPAHILNHCRHCLVARLTRQSVESRIQRQARGHHPSQLPCEHRQLGQRDARLPVPAGLVHPFLNPNTQQATALRDFNVPGLRCFRGEAQAHPARDRFAEVDNGGGHKSAQFTPLTRWLQRSDQLGLWELFRAFVRYGQQPLFHHQE